MTVVEEMFTTAGLSCFTRGERNVCPGTLTWTACWPVESCHSCLPVCVEMGAGAVAGGPASARPSMAHPEAMAKTMRLETMTWRRMCSSKKFMRALQRGADSIPRPLGSPFRKPLGLRQPAHADAGRAQDPIANSITGADLLHHHLVLRGVAHRHQIDGLGEVGVVAQTHHLDALRAQLAHLLRQRAEGEAHAVDERPARVARRAERALEVVHRLAERLSNLRALVLQDARLLALQAGSTRLAVLDQRGIAAHELV